MGITIHARAANEYAAELQQTTGGRRILQSYRRMIEDQRGITYTNAIGQPYKGWSDGQVAAYSRVHYLIATGAVQEVIIPLGAYPGRDRGREANQRKLTEGLPPEFTAEVFEGLSHHGDAQLRWTAGAVMPWVDGYGNTSEAPLCSWTDNAPLEIGHTDASRTLLHLMETGVVARWPYESEDIHLFFFATITAWTDGQRQQGLVTA